MSAIGIIRARLDIVRVAQTACELDGITPVELEQMRCIAGIAALQLHKVVGVADDTDSRAARADVRALTMPVMKLFRVIFAAANRWPVEARGE